MPDTFTRRGRLSLLFLLIVSLVPRAWADARADFLKLIDRPRVDLAPQEQKKERQGDLLFTHFTYASEASQRVPGILYEQPTEARRPAVIILHGTGGKKEGEAKFLKRLAAAGYVAVAIDARYHGERGNMKQYTAVIERTFAGESHEHPLYYDECWDVMRLIDYLQTRPDVDPKHIGLMGISKGGIETWLTSAVDERVACSVPCIGMQSFRWEVEHDSWHARMNVLKESFNASAKSVGVDKPDAAFTKQFFERVCPQSLGEFDGPSMITAIAPRPLLMINGGADALTPIDSVNACADAGRAAYKAAGAEDHFKQIVEENTGHKVTPESYDAILAWFDHWLK